MDLAKIPMRLKEKIDYIPLKSGVYKMKDIEVFIDKLMELQT